MSEIPRRVSPLIICFTSNHRFDSPSLYRRKRLTSDIYFLLSLSEPVLHHYPLCGHRPDQSNRLIVDWVIALALADAAFTYDCQRDSASGATSKLRSISRSVFLDTVFFSGDTSMSVTELAPAATLGVTLRLRCSLTSCTCRASSAAAPPLSVYSCHLS